MTMSYNARLVEVVESRHRAITAAEAYRAALDAAVSDGVAIEDIVAVGVPAGDIPQLEPATVCLEVEGYGPGFVHVEVKPERGEDVTVERDGLSFTEQHDSTDSDLRYAMGLALESLDDALFRVRRGRR